MDDNFGSVLHELGDQCWTTRDMVWPDLTEDAQVQKIQGFRRVGCRSSLVVPLSSIALPQAPMPDFVIEYGQFEVATKPQNAPGAIQNGFAQQGPARWPARQQPNPFQQNQPLQGQPPQDQSPRIRLYGLTSPTLRYEYAVASNPWKEYVMQRLRRWTWVELHKLEPRTRPEQFVGGIPHPSHASLLEVFQVPDTWDYADDQMPKWYQEWEQAKVESSPSRFSR